VCQFITTIPLAVHGESIYFEGYQFLRFCSVPISLTIHSNRRRFAARLNSSVSHKPQGLAHMPSLDFDQEKQEFRDFYSENLNLLEDAKLSFCALINALVSHGGNIAVSKIDGRVKDKEECIRKFNLKYRKSLETEGTPYSIKDHITDLIGIRIV